MSSKIQEKQIFIINTKISNKRREELYKNINGLWNKIFEVYGYSPRIVETINPKYVKSVIETETQDIPNYCIHSIGGDGTVNNILQSIDLNRGALQIHSFGTGNDTARSLNMKGTFEEQIFEAVGSPVDLGKINDRYFINVVDIGICSKSAENVDKFKKWYIPKRLSYALSLLASLNSFEPYKAQISSECTKLNDQFLLTLLAVCNARFFGGGFEISPNSDMTDGLFNVIKAKNYSIKEILMLVSYLLKKEHLIQTKIEGVTESKVSKLSISSDLELCCCVDGEMIYGDNFDITCHQQVLQLKQL